MFNYFIPETLDLASPLVHDDHVTVSRVDQQPPYRPIYGYGGTSTISRLTDLSMVTSMECAGVGGSTLQVYNFTDQPIALIDASNCVVICEPISAAHVYSGHVKGEVIIDVTRGADYNRLTPEMVDYLRLRKRAFVGHDQDDDLSHEMQRYGEQELCKYHHRIVLSEFNSLIAGYEGAVYIPRANVVISTLDKPQNIPVHPESPKSLRDAAGFDDQLSKPSFKLSIGLNDSAHQYDRAFVNVAGNVVEVEVSRDPTCEDGLRIYQQGIARARPVMEFYTTDTIADSPFVIYRSKQDAQDEGDRLKQRERAHMESKIRAMDAKQKQHQEEFELKQQQLQQQEELQREKHLRERELFEQRMREDEADRKRKIEEERLRIEKEEAARQARIREEDRLRKLKHEEEEKERIRKEREYARNEKVEKVSFWRKFVAEGVKAVAAVATAAACVMGWYLKRKSA